MVVFTKPNFIQDGIFLKEYLQSVKVLSTQEPLPLKQVLVFTRFTRLLLSKKCPDLYNNFPNESTP